MRGPTALGRPLFPLLRSKHHLMLRFDGLLVLGWSRWRSCPSSWNIGSACTPTWSFCACLSRLRATLVLSPRPCLLASDQVCSRRIHCLSSWLRLETTHCWRAAYRVRLLTCGPNWFYARATPFFWFCRWFPRFPPMPNQETMVGPSCCVVCTDGGQIQGVQLRWAFDRHGWCFEPRQLTSKPSVRRHKTRPAPNVVRYCDSRILWCFSPNSKCGPFVWNLEDAFVEPGTFEASTFTWKLGNLNLFLEPLSNLEPFQSGTLANLSPLWKLEPFIVKPLWGTLGMWSLLGANIYVECRTWGNLGAKFPSFIGKANCWGKNKPGQNLNSYAVIQAKTAKTNDWSDLVPRNLLQSVVAALTWSFGTFRTFTWYPYLEPRNCLEPLHRTLT